MFTKESMVKHLLACVKAEAAQAYVPVRYLGQIKNKKAAH